MLSPDGSRFVPNPESPTPLGDEEQEIFENNWGGTHGAKDQSGKIRQVKRITLKEKHKRIR
jgi:hypothetical protein